MRPIYDDPEAQRSSDEASAMMTRGRVHGRPDEEVPLFLRNLVAAELAAMASCAAGTFTDDPNADLCGGEAGLRAVEVAEGAVRSNVRRQVVQLPL
jgi:predicted dehydrogenase